MKYEWKIKDKDIYLPKAKPTVIDVPKFKYFTVRGKGNPNGEEFGKAVEALYSLSYGVKMLPKKGIIPPNYYEYTVFPLEGVWDLDDEAINLPYLDKDHFVYDIMIRQPAFVDDDLFKQVMTMTKAKKDNPYIDKVKLVELEEGLCVLILHIGSYDDEPRSFEEMKKFCEENGYKRTSYTHREIYLSDPRRASKDKLRTVLRITVRKD